MIIQSCGVLQKKQVEVAAAAKAQKIEFDPSRAGIGQQCFLLPRFLAFLRFSAHDIEFARKDEPDCSCSVLL